MLKLVAVAAMAATLAGCEGKVEQRARIDPLLPDGCRLIDLGEYGSIDTLAIIVCDGTDTTTVGNERHQCGKAPCPKEYVVYVPRAR